MATKTTASQFDVIRRGVDGMILINKDDPNSVSWAGKVLARPGQPVGETLARYYDEAVAGNGSTGPIMDRDDFARWSREQPGTRIGRGNLGPYTVGTSKGAPPAFQPYEGPNAQPAPEPQPQPDGGDGDDGQ